MQRLFDIAGRQALDRIMHARPLIAFDFDGTLSPIVARPDDARVPLPIAQRLVRLVERLPVAVITGRQVDDARPRLGFEPFILIGLHGAQGLRWSPSASESAALEKLRQRLHEQAPALAAAGVQVEDKALAFALHYRLAHDRPGAQECIRSVLEPTDPALHVFGGKCVVNVVPAQAPDKADAVTELLALSGRRALVFVGDDENDEPVFERARPDWLTIRVGHDGTHSAARYFIDGQVAMVPLLEELLARCTSATGSRLP